jgi:hypothetical protein
MISRPHTQQEVGEKGKGDRVRTDKILRNKVRVQVRTRHPTSELMYLAPTRLWERPAPFTGPMVQFNTTLTAHKLMRSSQGRDITPATRLPPAERKKKDKDEQPQLYMRP